MGGVAQDFEDFDISLLGLADYTLAPGEIVKIRVVNSVGTAKIDNIAFTGLQAIPEPSTLGIFGGAVGLVLLFRQTNIT